VVAGLVGSGAWAEGVAVGAKIGTLGLGAEVTVGLFEEVNARIGFNTGSYERNGEKLDDAEVDAELKLQTVPVLLDWHPGAGGFRVSAGAVLNNNEVDLSVSEGVTVELQGVDFVLSELNGKVEFDSLSYYFGIGYGNAASDDGGLGFILDVGVMYHGEPEGSATAVSAIPDPRVQQEVDRRLAAEVAKFNDDAKNFVVYPVISIGLSYGF
jgi:hypothetical protein